MLQAAIYDFVILFVVIDPVGTAGLFASMTLDNTAAERRSMAVRGSLIATAVLVVVAFAGKEVLAALGISLPAFRIAGGILLFLLAADMVFARQTGLRSVTAAEDAEAIRKPDISVFPLAIPLLAGPGAITTTVLLMGQAEGDAVAQAAVVLVLLVVMAASLVALLAAARLSHLLGETGSNVVSRLFGIVLAALAVQFVIDGVQKSFGLG
ncbi:MAG: NAAT family transporter [Proteobacteria bacterium]|nr:NAAT family transporter [Pseudomonadota bacterium]